jgi:peroxiredoxin Q/BCP
VVGISPDPVAKQSSFAGRHGFGFPLLSDPDHRVARAFGVARPLAVLGNRRATFVIGPDRRILGAVRSEVQMHRHADGALDVLRAASEHAGP